MSHWNKDYPEMATQEELERLKEILPVQAKKIDALMAERNALQTSLQWALLTLDRDNDTEMFRLPELAHTMNLSMFPGTFCDQWNAACRLAWPTPF